MASLSETLGDLTDLKVAGYFLETIMTIIKMVWQRPGGDSAYERGGDARRKF